MVGLCFALLHFALFPPWQSLCLPGPAQGPLSFLGVLGWAGLGSGALGLGGRQGEKAQADILSEHLGWWLSRPPGRARPAGRRPAPGKATLSQPREGMHATSRQDEKAVPLNTTQGGLIQEPLEWVGPQGPAHSRRSLNGATTRGDLGVQFGARCQLSPASCVSRQRPPQLNSLGHTEGSSNAGPLLSLARTHTPARPPLLSLAGTHTPARPPPHPRCVWL